MRPLLPLRLLAAALAMLPLSALADPIAYAVGFVDVYRIDLATSQATRVGPIGFTDVEGLAIGPNGVLYGVADATMILPGTNTNSSTTDFLLRINPTTGAGTLIGQLPGLQQPAPNAEVDYGLSFTCDGRLWMSSDISTNLWEVNPQTGAVTLIGAMGVPISGLAANAEGLYGVSVEAGGALYSINTATATATRIGSMGLADRMYDAGADFDASGRLWVTVDYFSPPTGLPPLRNDLAEVDPRTGRVISLRTITGAGSGVGTVQMEGMAIAPVPACSSGGGAAPTPIPTSSPWALWALLLLMLPLGLRRLR